MRSRAFAALLLGLVPASAAPGPDPQAIREVREGKRTTANAAWWGFDPANATAALQAAIRSGARAVVVPDMGRPWIVDPIELSGDQELTLERGVELQARRGGFRGREDALLTIADKVNASVTGYGASLVMRKEDYRRAPYEKAEWRHCLAILGSTGVRVSGLRCASSGGDGIYIGRTSGHAYSKDVALKDVVLEGHYRQAVSVISVDGLSVEDAVLRGTEGTAPAAGIDFEPNHPDERLTGITLKRCAIENNAGYGVLVASMNLLADGPPVDILIEASRIAGNGHGAIRVVSEAARGKVVVRSSAVSGGRALSKSGALRVEIESGR